MSDFCKKCRETFTIEDAPHYIIEHFNRHLEELDDEFASLENTIDSLQKELTDAIDQLEAIE